MAHSKKPIPLSRGAAELGPKGVVRLANGVEMLMLDIGMPFLLSSLASCALRNYVMKLGVRPRRVEIEAYSSIKGSGKSVERLIVKVYTGEPLDRGTINSIVGKCAFLDLLARVVDIEVLNIVG